MSWIVTWVGITVPLLFMLLSTDVQGQPWSKSRGKPNGNRPVSAGSPPRVATNQQGGKSKGSGPPNNMGEDVPPRFIRVRETKKNPHGGNRRQFPKEINLQFPGMENNMTLNLTWNYHVTDEAPVVIGTGKGKKHMKHWKSKGKRFGVYADPLTKASFVVKQSKKNKDVLDYAGTFYDGPDEYVMEPTYWDVSAAPLNYESTESSMYMVYKKKIQPITDSFESDERPFLPPSPFMTEESMWAARGEDVAQAITGQANYGVQSLVVVDYALYEQWLLASPHESTEDKVDDAIENIRFYFAHVMNGVDSRYRSIDDPDYKAYVSLAGYYIATNRAAAPFTQDYLTPGMPHGGIDSYAAIDGLIDWLQKNKADLPTHEQATLYTSDYLISSYSGNRILGLGKISAMCTPYAVTLNRDQGYYSSIQTGAHEMGHNLGALHDGTDNDCSTNDQYIMATNPQTLTDEVYKNAFTFSPCSVDEIKTYVKSLDSDDMNCLLDVAQPGDEDIPAILEKLPGDRYTPDEQCRSIFGQESFFCGGATEEMSICRTMECFDTQLRYCRATVEMRAATGTSCGDKKWCQEGDCVFDEDAKTGPDYCIYGDYDGPYRNDLSCAIIRNEQPWHCYNEYYLDDCCTSCAEIKSMDKPGCQYGDKDATCADINKDSDCVDPAIKEKCCATCGQEAGVCEDKASWCPTYYQTASTCYFDQDDTCCGSCKQFETGITGCEYGDKDGCSSFVTAKDCYDEEDVCCDTCRGLVVSDDENCRYGDKEDFCLGISAAECYTQSETCCYKCPLHYTGIQGCEYGDRVAGCTPADCDDPSRSMDCCDTCANRHTTPDPTCVDEASWCADIHPLFCYGDTKEICCKKCATHETGVTGCEYGDYHSWCKPLYCQSPTLKLECCETCRDDMQSTTSTSTTTTTTTTPSTTTTTPYQTCQLNDADWCRTSEVRVWPRDCLYYSNDSECCNLCQEYYTGDPECPYGDNAGWCSTYATSAAQCTDDVMVLCCQSCKQLI